MKMSQRKSYDTLFNGEVNVNFLVPLLFVCLEFVDQCHDSEMQYILGENYIKGNCTQNCSCSEVRYVGHVEQCAPLCPSISVRCLLEYIPEFYQKILKEVNAHAENGDV